MSSIINNSLRKLLIYDQKKDWDKKALEIMKDSELILDAGCGLGRFISQNPDKIIGLESNPANLRACEKKGYKVTSGNLTNIPFENEKFDGIYCSHVIEHLNHSELHQTLEEFNRILKNNGWLIIAAPLLWKHFYSDLTHVRPYNPESLIHYLVNGTQRTKKIISQDYKIVEIYWRHTPLPRLLFNNYNNNLLRSFFGIFLGIIDGILYKLHFNFFLPKNGYMLTLKKCSK